MYKSVHVPGVFEIRLCDFVGARSSNGIYIVPSPLFAAVPTKNGDVG